MINNGSRVAYWDDDKEKWFYGIVLRVAGTIALVSWDVDSATDIYLSQIPLERLSKLGKDEQDG